MTLEVDLAHDFGGFRLDARFACAPGLTALFGRSGAGKTTLVNAIAGLLRPDRARIAINGRALVDTQAGIFMPPHRRRIGYVFQDGRLLPHFSVRANLLYGRFFAGAASGRADAIGFDHVVDLLGIRHLLARRPGTLSGGEKQRVAIGRALLSRPELLLMDEPLAALDAARKEEILPYLERLRDELKLPIVYVSHAIPEVTRLADTVVLLSEGQVQAVGSVPALTGRLDLFPLTGRYEAGAVLTATLVRQEEDWGLSLLRCNAGDILVPRLERPIGSSLRIRIRARDVTLALTPPAETSALNILAGTVSELKTGDGPQIEVRLDCNGDALLARITRLSAARLALAPGKPVYAMIKTVALDGGSLGRPR
ncbi:MAG: molybdenum ABC transporter ATP-binding protein [Ferrovibrio sp.]|uniref:molybdenum ABC transporter ATP-binding protein n=1 Tax=Ferrovibrio sp. TaxID=1917215 RepID=UPI002601E84A|nr:molybdenum ABC transporter ATP-binding protein [Ferrovibrio sp.]MCW0234376.1 molybdenum ABC transporter ATP-binding protein [Ferrovibrio sp.]